MLLSVLAALLLSAGWAQADDGSSLSAALPASVTDTEATGTMRVADQRSAANKQNQQQQRVVGQVTGPGALAPGPPTAREESASPLAPAVATEVGPTAAPAQAQGTKQQQSSRGAAQPAFPGLVGTTGSPAARNTPRAEFPGRQQTVRTTHHVC